MYSEDLKDFTIKFNEFKAILLKHDLEELKIFFNENKMLLKTFNYWGIRYASTNNKIDILEFLLEIYQKQNEDQDGLFVDFCSSGDINVVKTLLKKGYSNISFGYNIPIREAMTSGSFNIVELLIKKIKIDPEKNKFDVIKDTINNNVTNLNQSLIHTLPTFYNNFAIKYAHAKKYEDIVSLLWKNDDVQIQLKENDFDLFNSIEKYLLNIKINEF